MVAILSNVGKPMMQTTEYKAPKLIEKWRNSSQHWFEESVGVSLLYIVFMNKNDKHPIDAYFFMKQQKSIDGKFPSMQSIWNTDKMAWAYNNETWNEKKKSSHEQN